VKQVGWVYLVAAGFFEIAYTTAFRYIAGWAKPWPIAIFALSSVLSLYLLWRALETVPLGTAYAVWTGMGAAGTAIIGMIWFQEPSTTVRLVLLTFLIGSIVGLKLTSA
jgi:quaternary ammonium compound-resistance protein SugE